MKLEKYVDILSGYAFKSQLFNTEKKGIPIIRIRDVTSNAVSTYYDGQYKNEYLIANGDLLIGMDGRFNLIEWGGGKALLNQRVCKITPRVGKVDTNFIKHLLPKSLKEIEDRTSFVTVKHLSVKDIKEISLPKLPLTTQIYIASILDDAAALRDKTAQLLNEYDLLAQSIFLDMFGDPSINQKDWPMKSFGEVGKLDRGKSKHRPRNAPELLGGKYPLIQTGDIANSNGYIRKYKSTYSEIGLAQSKLWSAGTLCIAIAANIANTGILTMDACFPDSVVGFIPNEYTNNEFTLYWISFLQKIIEANAPQAAQKNINLKILRELEFFCPPIHLQNQFAEKIALIEQQKELAKQELKESEDLFNCLLQKAFKGELIQEEVNA